jgi:hypothetical protein
MLKNTALFILLILLSDLLYSQFSNNEPHAIFRDGYKNKSAFIPDFADNPLFTNINLTNEAYPQNEPSVHISRVNPNIVVAAWRDFRLGYSPAVRRIGYTYSTNGGQTWAVSQLLPDPAPEHATQSDPVLINDASGNFYIATTSREITNTTGQTVIYKSTNNGVNWVKYSVAAASGAFEDKEWITCDLIPGSPYFNSLYISWTRIGQGIRFMKSTNAGLNWTAAVVVGDNTSGQGSNIVVGTNSFIYVVWASSGIKFDRSTNGGTSFGTDYSLSTITSQPNTTFPFICVDYSNHTTRGNVYVVWADNRQGTGDDVWFQRSTNAGASWITSPVRINDVTTNDQYWPVIQCDTNGVLYVMYYDERTGLNITNSYIAYSTDAGNTWVNQRMSDQSFPLTVVNQDVRIGDYINIDAYNGKIIPVWTDDRLGTPNQEIYTAQLGNLLGVEKNINNLPSVYKLNQNYPNPFNPVTNITYSIPKTSYISIKLYDVLGNLVDVLVDGYSVGGDYTISYNASKLSSGIYFYTMETRTFKNTKKMILVK